MWQKSGKLFDYYALKISELCGHYELVKYKLCALKMNIMQNYCKFVLAQQPTNRFNGKVEYCGLKN